MNKSQRRRKRIQGMKARKIRTKNTNGDSHQLPEPWKPAKMKLFEMPPIFPPDLAREQRIEIIGNMGKKAKEDFDKKFPAIKEWFVTHDPLDILSCCAFYLLTYPEGADAEAYVEKLGFYPYYLEIMQSFALMQQRNISIRPLARDLDRLKKEMMEIGESMRLKVFDSPKGATEKEVRERAFLSQIRQQTTAVRNWSYLHQMLQVGKDLASTVKEEFKNKYDLDPEKLIDGLTEIPNKAEDKLNFHGDTFRYWPKKKDYREMMRSYQEAWPDLVPLDEQSLEEIYDLNGRDTGRIRSLLRTHSDLRLPDIYTITLDEIVNMYGDASKKDALREVLDFWSFQFGDLATYNPEHFVLDNPVLNKPFIKLGEGKYYSSIVGIFPHLTLSLIEVLISVDETISKKYGEAKASYLEDAVQRLVTTNFPNGRIYRGSKWVDPSSQIEYENDLTVMIDSFAIIMECKAGSVTPAARRGAPLRLAKKLNELIVDPAKQAGRFIDYLKMNEGHHNFRTESGHINRMDNTNIKYYIPVSVTLENLGFMSSNLKDAIAAGIVRESIDSLAPSMCLTDLECIFEVLETEVEKVHYLARRREFERHVNYLADELDLLGFYLDNGFNIGEVEYDGSSIVLAGTSKELDSYFVAKSLGKKAKKPQLQMTQWWRDIIAKLSVRRPQQ